jgi:hypothetical protein
VFVVSEKRTNRWNDLLIWNRDSNVDPTQGFFSVLQFDGTRYPERSWEAPKLDQPTEGIRYMANPALNEFGVRLGD